jgi:hypothetical protein
MLLQSRVHRLAKGETSRRERFYGEMGSFVRFGQNIEWAWEWTEDDDEDGHDCAPAATFNAAYGA